MTAFDAELITGLVRWQNDGRVPLTSDDRFDFAAWLIGQLGNFIILLLDRRMGQIEEAGRDPASISITIYVMDADRDAVRRYEEAGADRLVALPGRASTEREAIDVMERFGELLV